MQERIHVAAAVITNTRGEILISRRHASAHQGGLWEFPGGKLEHDEDVYEALVREIYEELGITITSAHPLIRIPHDYPDKKVLLDVWQVKRFSGDPHGREGQEWCWVSKDSLNDYSFPEANRPIVKAARLPALYQITGTEQPDMFLNKLKQCLEAGVRLIQFRIKEIDKEAYRSLAVASVALCKQYDAVLMLNAEPAFAEEIGADGVHLNTERMMALTRRPWSEDKWIAGSCHNEKELLHACKLGLDFVVLSPVLATPSHPGEPFLGWETFRALTEKSTIPVFALGGMHPENVSTAFENGAQGVAVLSPIWKAENIAEQVKRYLS